MSFEKKIEKLEKIISVLDSPDTGLEDLVKKYEEGMALVAELREQLSTAEQRIIDITKKAGKSE